MEPIFDKCVTGDFWFTHKHIGFNNRNQHVTVMRRESFEGFYEFIIFVLGCGYYILRVREPRINSVVSRRLEARFKIGNVHLC